MIIAHNMMAINTHRQLGINGANSQKSIEKLSSGQRINRAGDDAAGLSISEKMRAQIRGLDQSSRNAQDGISMIQTAEGALQETEAILQRMRELSIQASNGTNTDEDRSSIQNEISQLTDEIDRIGDSTEFNKLKLLDGSASGSGAAAGPNSVTGSQVFKQSAGKLTGVAASGVNTTSAGDEVKFSKTDALLVDGNKIEIDWNNLLTDAEKASMKGDWSSTPMTADESAAIRDAMERAINQAIDNSGTGVEHIKISDSTAGKFVLESGSEGNDSKVELYMGNGADLKAKLADGTTDSVDSGSVLDSFLGASAEMASGTVAATNGTNTVLEASADKINIKIGDHTIESVQLAFVANNDANTNAATLETAINTAIKTYNTDRNLSGDDKLQDVTVSVEDGRLSISNPSGAISLSDVGNGTGLKALGLDQSSRSSSGNGAVKFQIGANRGQTIGLSLGDMRSNALGVSGVNVSSPAGADAAIDKIDSAIEKISSERGKLGAYQNRLEHTIKNLNTSSENLTAAESRIRDVDMAKEMMNHTKNNILQQAAQAMLAQANQAPQGVLQLLR